MTTTTQALARPVPKPPFTPVRAGLLQRKCACGGTPGPSGECEECRRKRLTGRRNPSAPTRAEAASPDQQPGGAQQADRAPVQPRLVVNAPGDEYEREADLIAGQVMRMVDPSPKQAIPRHGRLGRET